MNKHYTDITLVVDRSGSMESCKTDAEGGLNTFIQEQATEPGKGLLTLVEFDDKYDFVHRGMPLAEVPRYGLVPRGMTALYDAVGRAINETGERLAAMPEEERPGAVIFAIVTDGHENSSHEFTHARVKDMIEHQKATYNWQFTFLGADMDAVAIGAALGVGAGGSVATSSTDCHASYATLSKKVSQVREAAILGQSLSIDYTADEREEAAGKKLG